MAAIAASASSAAGPYSKSAYRPEIDGLRALAVFAVIVNHFNKDILPGGYLGVDIFFVISGFVIISSLAGRASKTFGDLLMAFYIRRIKRLVPALGFFVVITSILICLFNPDPTLSLRTGIASLFGLSNLYLLRQSTDYFAISTELNVFTHTWSLGVEEQFYFLFPFLFWFTGFSRLTTKGARNLFWVICALSVASLIGFVYLYRINQPAAYFLMPTRLWELGVGCLLFFGLKQPNKIVYAIQKVPPLLVTTVVLGVLFIPLQFAVSATIAVVVLTAILIACLHSGTAGYYFFTLRPVVYLGLISYSLYLWHWVVLSLSRWTIGIHWWSVPVQVALMLLVSIASYRYIETPLRRADWSVLQWKSIGYGLGASASAALFLIALDTSLGHQMFLGDPDAIGSLPKPATAASGTNISLENCKQESDIVFKLCDAPAIGSSVRMLVLGDSHSAQFLPLFGRLRQEYGIGLTAYVVGSNPPAQVFPPIPNLGPGVSSRTEWNRLNAYPLKFLDRFISNAKSGDIIFLGSRVGGHFGTGNIWHRRYFDGTWRPISVDEAYENWVRSVLDLSKKVQDKGIRIIVLSPLPEFPVSEHFPADACSIQWYRPQYLVSSDCASNFEVDALMVKTQYSNLRSKLLRIASQSSNLFVYDPLPVLCPNERKVCTSDGRFADDNHLSDRGSLSLYEDFTAFLRRYNLLKQPAS